MITINGTGCSLADYIYVNIDFNSQSIKPYLSKENGDGGLSPGRLVFTEDLENFANEKIDKILNKIIGDKNPDHVNIGGPAIVAMINASQLLNDVPSIVNFYGGLGNDDKSKFIIEQLKRTPVNISNYIELNNYSSFTIVLSDPNYDNGNGERMFINNLGVAKDYQVSNLGENFHQSDILFFGGTALLPQIHDDLLEILEKDKNNNCINIVATVYDFRNEKMNPNKPWTIGKSAKTYEFIDLMIMDYEEALKLSGEREIDKSISYFKKNKVKACIVTHGPYDLYLYSDGGLFEEIELKTLPISEKIKEELKYNKKGDTTGSGDNFAGGVLASIAMQMYKNKDEKINLVDACAWGVASGGFANFYIGGTYFEKSPGEKLSLVKPYYENYKKQIKE